MTPTDDMTRDEYDRYARAIRDLCTSSDSPILCPRRTPRISYAAPRGSERLYTAESKVPVHAAPAPTTTRVPGWLRRQREARS